MQPITSGLPAGGAQLPPAPQQTGSVLAALVVTGPVSVRRPHVSRPLAGWGTPPGPRGPSSEFGAAVAYPFGVRRRVPGRCDPPPAADAQRSLRPRASRAGGVGPRPGGRGGPPGPAASFRAAAPPPGGGGARPGDPSAGGGAARGQPGRGARPPVHLTPTTTDRSLAVRWFEQFEGAGLDGVIAKP